ncbi:MAG: RidA family protein [Pseudomonadota bacterium]
MQDDDRIKALSPPGMAAPLARYAHGVLHPPSGLILTSGQLSIAEDGTVPQGPKAQAKLIFQNIEKILLSGGSGKAGVLRINAYVTDRAHMAGYMSARDAWLADVPHLPASTLMIVSGFTRPDFLVEIEVAAMQLNR